MKVPFSKLEKDDKTFNYVCMYYDLISKNSKEISKELFELDLQIQCIEMEEHLKRSCKEHDKNEQIEWTTKNSEPLRIWLNSLKEISLFMYLDNQMHYRNVVVKDLLYRYIDLYNSKYELITTIRI